MYQKKKTSPSSCLPLLSKKRLNKCYSHSLPPPKIIHKLFQSHTLDSLKRSSNCVNSLPENKQRYHASVLGSDKTVIKTFLRNDSRIMSNRKLFFFKQPVIQSTSMLHLRTFPLIPKQRQKGYSSSSSYSLGNFMEVFCVPISSFVNKEISKYQ